MGDNIIEALIGTNRWAQASVRVQDIHVLQGNIAQTGRIHHSLTLGQLARREIDAHKLGVWQALGHGDEIATTGTTQLQHLAVFHRWRAHAQQGGHRGQAVWMGHLERIAGIWYPVIDVLAGCHWLPDMSQISARKTGALTPAMANSGIGNDVGPPFKSGTKLLPGWRAVPHFTLPQKTVVAGAEDDAIVYQHSARIR